MQSATDTASVPVVGCELGDRYQSGLGTSCATQTSQPVQRNQRGSRRYGFNKQALQVLESIVNPGQHFEHARLPEVFGGFSQRDFSIPVRYPVACHPQAWAAGSVPFMMSSLLGLTADALNKHLRVVRPVLPSFVNELDFRRIKIGDSTIDLQFERVSDAEVHVEVVNHNGSIKVEVEQNGARLEAA